MRYEVDDTPEKCAERTEGFFALRWPHGGQYRRSANTVMLSKEEPHSRVLDFAKMVVSFGAFGASGPPVNTAEAAFVKDGGRTVAIIEASTPEFAETLQGFATEELSARPI